MILDTAVTRLPNGLRVATAAIDRAESVALGIWIGVGGRHERRAASGISHFIEHLLFKGTRTRSARDISQAIEGRGGYCNAFTQEEATCYYARIARAHAWEALDVLADMVRRPRFDPVEIEKERGVIIEEIRMGRDQPEQVVQDMLGGILWKHHPLGRPLAGSPGTIRALTRAEILAFKTGAYVPANTCVVLAGRLSHADAVARVAAATRGLRPRPPPVGRPVTGRVPQERLALQAKPIEQTHAALGFRTFGRTDRRRYALKLLNVILGENMSSRLFQVVREQHGLAYAIHSGAQLFAETGVLAISAGLDRRRHFRALALIIREARRLKASLVSRSELDRAKEFATGQLRLALESPSGHLMWTGEHLLHVGTILAPETAIRGLEAVRPEALRQLANTLFRQRAASLAWLAPAIDRGDERRIRALLAAL